MFMMLMFPICLHKVKCEGQGKPPVSTQESVWLLKHHNIQLSRDVFIIPLPQLLVNQNAIQIQTTYYIHISDDIKYSVPT